MNNSYFAIENNSLSTEETTDNSERFAEKETELVAIIGAIRGIQSSKEWSILKEKVFDSLPMTLEKEMGREARKENPDTLKLNRLAGQLKWAEKYSDLSKLEEAFMAELLNVKKQLYGKT